MNSYTGHNVMGRPLVQYEMEDYRNIVVRVFEGNQSEREDGGINLVRNELTSDDVLVVLKQKNSTELNELMKGLLKGEDKVLLSQGGEAEGKWMNAWIDLELEDRYVQVIHKQWQRR